MRPTERSAEPGDALAAYVDRRLDEALQRVETAPPIESVHDGAPRHLVDAAMAAAERLGPSLVELSRDIHEHPELCFEEQHATAAAARLLERHGVDVEVGPFGLPTAFRARLGGARPRVAIIAEYDALPGLGHACGHNIICASAVGAFLSLKDLVEETGGSVELIGSPAEEGGAGKELIIQGGGFAEIDAAMMIHPANLDVLDQPMLGFRQVTVTYEGRAAHAAASPFLGRNALDAVVTAYNALSQLRQHILPSDRIHGVITDGGKFPNIIPAQASATFFVRSIELETLAHLCDRVQGVFEGAALTTGTTLDVNWDVSPPYLPLRANAALGSRFAMHARSQGRRLVRGETVAGGLGASTDMGNVSQLVPSIHPCLAISPPGVSPHMPGFVEYAVGSTADRAMMDGAKALAATALDFLADGALRADAGVGFTDLGAPVTVREVFGE